MPDRERPLEPQSTGPAELEESGRILAEREERAELLRNPRELIRRGHAAEADAVAERVRQCRIAGREPG